MTIKEIIEFRQLFVQSEADLMKSGLDTVSIANYQNRISTMERWIESKLQSEYKRGVEEVIEAVESRLYTENGFFREDESVAPDVQSVLQDIKLHSQTNSSDEEKKI